MTVSVLENDSLLKANERGWNESEKGFLNTTKGIASANWQYINRHPYKTAATFLAIATVASLTSAYFLSSAYAAFVGTVGTKAATLVSPAITAVSAFLFAHPLVASLIVVAAVAALIAAPVYAYKNSSKANQIDAVKEVFNKCEKDKDGDKPAMDGGKVKVKDGDASTLLTEIGIAIGVVPAPTKA